MRMREKILTKRICDYICLIQNLYINLYICVNLWVFFFHVKKTLVQ